MKTDLVASYVVLLVCLGYASAAWIVQKYRVAPPRDWLLERMRFLEAQITAEDWAIKENGLRDLKEEKQSIDKNWLLVAVSKVQAGWRLVHGLDDHRVPELPLHTVRERLQTAQTRLKAIPGVQAAALVERIKGALKCGDSDRQRAVLQEAEVFRHNHSDSNYEDLANILGKSVWLTVVALAIIVALAALFDRESFFLLGAAGGLISRLSRVLRRRPKASDYGAEWSTLILSPAGGALVGWVGIVFAYALANDPFNVLDDGLAAPWSDATAPLGLVLAFLFGFSERLFSRLLRIGETQVGGLFLEEDEKSGGVVVLEQ